MNNGTSIILITFPPIPIGGLDNFTGLILYALGLLVTLVVIGAVIFGPRDGLCCELCGFCWIECYRECCKRRKHYTETLDKNIRAWKDRSGPGLLNEDDSVIN
jgi:hypothetical protein